MTIYLSPRRHTACDTDATKQGLLATALADPTVQSYAAALGPKDAPAGWQPGTFELAVAVRENLPAGLAPGDFDGVNIEAAL